MHSVMNSRAPANSIGGPAAICLKNEMVTFRCQSSTVKNHFKHCVFSQHFLVLMTFKFWSKVSMTLANFLFLILVYMHT